MFQGCNRKKVHLCFLHSRFAMRPVYSTPVFLFLGIFQLNTRFKVRLKAFGVGMCAAAQTQPQTASHG